MFCNSADSVGLSDGGNTGDTGNTRSSVIRELDRSRDNIDTGTVPVINIDEDILGDLDELAAMMNQKKIMNNARDDLDFDTDVIEITMDSEIPSSFGHYYGYNRRSPVRHRPHHQRYPYLLSYYYQ